MVSSYKLWTVTSLCVRLCCFCLFFQNDQVLQGFSVDKGEFTCPLCRQLANSVIPCQPSRGLEANAWHAPTTKKICVLVKEVEDLQEQLAPFPVRTATWLPFGDLLVRCGWGSGFSLTACLLSLCLSFSFCLSLFLSLSLSFCPSLSLSLSLFLSFCLSLSVSLSFSRCGRGALVVPE